jgi:RNA polymerase-binding transcription factor DksA
LNNIQFNLGKNDFEGTVVNDNPSDFMDKASREFDQHVELTMRGRERIYIRELQRAIMRIDGGYSESVKSVRDGYRNGGSWQDQQADFV